MEQSLALLDASAQADLVSRGDASPLELVDAAIERIESCNPTLNAVITPLFEKARAQAESPELPEGPFRGVPFLLKDLLCHSEGDPLHEGMAFLKRHAWREPADSFLAAKFRAAGLICLGKTNCPELGPMTTTEPAAYGPTRNPWNPDHSAGGSSGGSAAAVASGMVPVAHANDGGGSIRIPASECGLVGLKPSRGRTSLGPHFGEHWNGLTVEHVVTRSVRDSAAVLSAVATPMPGDPYTAAPPLRPWTDEVGVAPGRLRIGLCTSVAGRGIETHADCVAAANATGLLLEALGHDVELAQPPGFDDPDAARDMALVIAACTASDLDYWGERTGVEIRAEDVEPISWELASRGREITGGEYVSIVRRLHVHSRRVAQWWADGFDLLLTPTLCEPPPPLGSFPSTPEEPLTGFLRSAAFVAYTAPYNITGQPAISLPLVVSEAGLPIGVQLGAASGREDLLIRVAAQLEAASDWSARRPAVHA